MEFIYFIYCILFVPIILLVAYAAIRMRVMYLTSPESLDPREFRAIVLGMFVCTSGSVSVFRLWFSNALWSDIFQLSLPIGFLLGLLLGIGWQFCIHKRMPKLFGKASTILIALILLAAVASIVNVKHAVSVLGEQDNQLRSVRSIAKLNIMQANLILGSGAEIILTNFDEIEAVRNSFTNAKILDSKEGTDLRRIRLEIKTDANDFVYEAYLPRSGRGDIVIRFPENDNKRLIHLPGSKCWLDANALENKNSSLKN